MGLAHSPSIVRNGLVLHLDAANRKSYPGSGTTWTDLSGSNNHFTLFNSPVLSGNKLIFNGTTQYAKSTNNINLTLFDSITTIIVSRTTATTGGIMFEHSTNWNTNIGGFGLGPHNNGNLSRVNLHHTNHTSIAARNYVFNIGTNWASHTNIFSRTVNSTGRLTYTNGESVNFSSEGGYSTGTNTIAGSFLDSQMFIASRGGTGSFCPLEVGIFMIYNRILNAAEIRQNYEAYRDRYGI